ncbi:MAG TPA: type II secretion system protein GspC [Polyangia bacterium]|nr:type II secretion system protein GspC [Polyangia bacterium]
MEALLRKYLWGIDLAVIALCAVFLARAASSAVESSIVVPPIRAAVHAPRAQQAVVYSKDVLPILKRNVFCSTCPPYEEKTDTNEAKGPTNEPPAKTNLPLALMAIMYAPPPPGLTTSPWSVAVVRDTEDKSTGAFGAGQTVHNAKILEIQETRVYLDNGGKTEYIDLLDNKPGGGESAPVAAAPTPAPGGGDTFAAEMAKGIKKTSEHAYDIQRSTLESVLGNMSLLSRSARIVPEIRDGKAAGFRLYSVRPDGPFALIGMQNGDVISSINGLEITSPEKALEVYAKLKSASHLSLGLERNGQKVTKDYSIR